MRCLGFVSIVGKTRKNMSKRHGNFKRRYTESVRVNMKMNVEEMRIKSSSKKIWVDA